MSKLIAVAIGIVAAFSISSCITSRWVIESDSSNPPAMFLMPTGNATYPPIIRLINPAGYFYCSGIVIDANYALTAAHCVTNSIGGLRDEEISIYDKYSNPTIKARAIAADNLRDVAFIRGDFNEFQAAKVDFNGSNFTRGMSFISCGFPGGQFYEFCTELIHTGNRNFQIRANGGPIFKGMSGGPVYDKDTGIVMGVNSAVDETDIIIAPLTGVLESVGLQ